MPAFFQKRPIKQFNYTPRYYSEEKERVEELKRRIESTGDNFDEVERRNRMREALRSQRPLQKKRKGLMTSTRLIVIVILVVVLIYLIS